MKKLFTVLSIGIALFSYSQAPTTCSLDPVFINMNKYGIWPDSANNFVSGVAGQPYGQNITVKIPKDTVQSVAKICFTRFEVSTPGGFTNFNLPPGLNFLAGPTVTNTSGTFQFPGNANSCAVISGTPTTPGTYTVQFRVQAFGNPIPVFSTCPSSPNTAQGSAVNSSTLSYYVINISPIAAIEELSKEKFNLSNQPNPASGKTDIRFNVNDESLAKLDVYDVLGKRVYENKIRTRLGPNTFDVNVNDWNNGIYIYTISYKNYSETRKMIVNNNR
jgi:hypothetical protein